MEINIQVNGNERTIDTAQVNHLESLIRVLLKKDKGIIAEVNEQLVHRDKWRQYHLKEGDAVELINFVGGG